jgi:hypothetical protein
MGEPVSGESSQDLFGFLSGGWQIIAAEMVIH